MLTAGLTRSGDRVPLYVFRGVPHRLDHIPGRYNLPRPPGWAASGMPVLPSSQWVRRDLKSSLGLGVLNQQSHGSCGGYSAARCLMLARCLEGFGQDRLSGSYIYSWTNGNRDAGSNISDNGHAIVTHGACLDATCDWNHIYRYLTARYDAEAARFRAADVFILDDFSQAWETICTALTLGFAVNAPIEVGNGFENLDADLLPPVSRGYGNHAICLESISMSGPPDAPYLDLPQSWGPQFGDSGYCRYSRDHLDALGTANLDITFTRAASPDPDAGPWPKPHQ